MDYKQMFDSEKLDECLLALSEAVDNDILPVLYEANKKTSIAVKTPAGEMSRRDKLKKNMMQGEVMTPLISLKLVDNFGKKCLEDNEHIYNYKEKVRVPPLGQVDDLMLISECGFKTTKMNAFINTQTNMAKLYFSADKCKQMHIGKTKN